MWRIIIILVGLLFVESMSEEETSTSKACYGNLGLTCAEHNLICTRGSIAISEAYYTDNTECRIALSNCVLDVSNVTETGEHYDFNESEMAFLYSNCSFKASCRYIAPRRSALSSQFKVFSVVKYKCIRDSGYACSSVEIHQMNSTSLFWSESEIQTQCDCALSTLTDNINVSVYALDMRPNKIQLCTSLTISIHDQPLQLNCSSPILPYRLLAFTSLSGPTEVDLNVRESSVGGFIWIRVQGTHPFDLQCPAPVTSTVTGTPSTTLMTSSSSTRGDSTETAQYKSTSTQQTPPVDERTTTLPSTSLTSLPIPTDSSNVDDRKTSTISSTTLILSTNSTGAGPESRNGPVIGAVVSSIIVASALALAVFFFLRRRRRRADKKGTTVSKKSPNQEESYALAGAVTENYYHELEKQKAKKIPVDYDYASADGLGNSLKSGDSKVKDNSKRLDQDRECDYDHIGDTKTSHTGDYDTTASVAHDVRLKTKHVPEDKDMHSYDNLNGKPGTGNTSTGNNALPQSTEYDTTASTKKDVAELDNKEKNLEGDYYGYNHLGSNQKAKTIQNEYDTTASAAKAVSDLETTTAMENDYDHFQKKNDSKTVASTYDTAGNVRSREADYSIAGTTQELNPYDMAK